MTERMAQGSSLKVVDRPTQPIWILDVSLLSGPLIQKSVTYTEGCHFLLYQHTRTKDIAGQSAGHKATLY